jgi:hypothetical protein
VFEYGFTGTSHIREHRLTEMPSEKLVGHAMWIFRIAANWIKTFSV